MRTLYHGTSSRNLDSIKANGLIPGHAKGGDAYAKDHYKKLAALTTKRKPSVFVSDNIADASEFSRISVEELGGDPIIITLHIPEAVFQEYEVDELFEEDAMANPHAWRAPHVDASYIGEVMAALTADPRGHLLQLLTDLLA